ncbi:MAG TPA: hypothetical protein VFJ51_10960 [Nitrososphaeraceae archaeon]|nr:hypothetical protein [Nitrososphaeraceae archaeon]
MAIENPVWYSSSMPLRRDMGIAVADVAIIGWFVVGLSIFYAMMLLLLEYSSDLS